MNINKNPTRIELLIIELDKTLSMLRDGWIEAKEENKLKWMDRIDSILDKRLELMAIRDNQQLAC